MASKALVPIVLPNLATAPATPGNGELYYNTATHKAMVRANGGWARVNEQPAGGTAGQVLEKIDGTDYNVMWATLLRALVLNSQTVSYTLVLTDAEDIVLVSNAAANNLTVPTNATVAFPLGTRIRVAQTGAGATTIVPAGGVTLRYPSWFTTTLMGQGAVIELIKIGTDEWILNGSGNLAWLKAWSIYSPNITATTSGPNLGTTPVRKGYYFTDQFDRVTGGATVRWDTTGTPTAGSGTYRCSLPIAGINYEDNGYSPIGAGSLGVGLVHTTGLLHFNGITPSTSSAVIAMHGGLFVTGAAPTGTRDNCHWVFQYES